MKIKLQLRVILAAVITSLTTGHAIGSTASPEILSDDALAAVRGGFCPFEICESSASGVCQPIPDNEADICSEIKCSYNEEQVANVVVYACRLTGNGDTCTEPSSYHQCVWAFKLSYCSYGDVPVCGDMVIGDCLPNTTERMCVCRKKDTGSPCSWTDCAK